MQDAGLLTSTHSIALAALCAIAAVLLTLAAYRVLHQLPGRLR